MSPQHGESVMVRVEGLGKTYSSGGVVTPVLRDLSFRVHEGELVAIMGTSGTGKTTLLNILGCLDAPTSGEYRLDGTDVVRLDDEELSRIRNRKIGFVFQQFHLLSRASALKNVLLPLIYADEYPEGADDRARTLLDTVGLADRVEYRPNELSGGQQQRVALARALITDPRIILADEPTGNLDERAGLEVLAILKRLHEQGRTILVVTHDPEIAQHAERVIVLAGGTIVEDRVVDRPRDPRRRLAALAADGSAADAGTTVPEGRTA